ncbi:MAG: GSCFA domain-containing protein [Bacteroidales bacterium]|jgi:hypothetical protein|nr:GSCFA domain-containing protein [Bacteroidales bacterium]
MELFRTIVKCIASPDKIGYGTPLLILGSCFAENLGLRLQQLKFDVVLNPFGIVYHPAPAAHNLERIIAGNPYTTDELQHHNELWCSFDHHGRFSHPDVSECLRQINAELSRAHDALARSEWLFVTFGTAWAYRLKSSSRIVANCHKFPASDFKRIRFDVDEICAIWEETIDSLRQLNPAVKIVFTVSPIRHLRDGAHENQLSKSTLLLAVDRLNHELADTGYFPAYEIVLDELRDYRFYNEDMTHPNDTAINYIWQRFCENYVTKDTLQTMKAVEDIIKAVAHRPIHHTSGCRKFADACLEKISKLKQQYPRFDFTEETELFISMQQNSRAE